MRRRLSKRLLIGLAVSLFLHALLSLWVGSMLRTRPQTQMQQPEMVVMTSSALRITHRTRPRPPLRKEAVPPQPTLPVPQQQKAAAPRPIPQQRRELARFNPHAPAMAPHVHPHQQQPDLAAQQEQFEKTIAKLRQENNPVVSAARPVVTPEAQRQYSFDLSGSVGTHPQAEGILTPEQSWHADGYDYYYVRYWVQYDDGSTETGTVPWPLRYLPEKDPFRLGIQHFPLPVPLPDYTLPPGTNLHPLVAFCYEHRAELTNCPIAHD